MGRLRCSRGLAVDKYIGSFHRRVETDLNFPALSCDHAFAAKLLYEVGRAWYHRQADAQAAACDGQQPVPEPCHLCACLLWPPWGGLIGWTSVPWSEVHAMRAPASP